MDNLIKSMTQSNQRDRYKKGFTIIELLMAMSILGVLVMFASSHLLTQQERTHLMTVRNNIMLVEGKIGEHIELNSSRIHGWPMVKHTELEKVVASALLYDPDGVIREVAPYVYRRVPVDFLNTYAPNDLEGVFFMSEDGGVYFAEVDDTFEFEAYVPPKPNSEPDPDPSEDEKEDGNESDVEPPLIDEDVPPRVITPESKINEDEAWVYRDYSYSDDTISGLSEEGQSRYDSGDRTLVLPDVNPYTGETMTSIGESAFRGYRFEGDLISETIEDIERSAFRNSHFTGEFLMPNIKHIGDDAFRFSHFTGQFKTPYVESIGRDAFRNSQFYGEFYAPNVEHIGNNAFRYSHFTNKQFDNYELSDP